MADIDGIIGTAAHGGIGQSGLRIIVVDQVGLGEGLAAELVAGLGHVDDQGLGLAAHEFFDMVLIGVDIALIHLGLEFTTGQVGFRHDSVAEERERGRILIGNRQLGLSVRRGLVEDGEGHGIAFGKLPIRRRDRERERSLVAAGREVRGHRRGAGDETGLVDDGDGRRGGRSGLDTEDINADRLSRRGDADRRRLVRREIILRAFRLGTGLISGLFRAGEKSRHGGERHENVC